MQGAGGSGGAPAVSTGSGSEGGGALPPPPAGANVGSRIRPPVAATELTAQLADVGFSKGKSRRNGDCFPMSAMAGFEITTATANNPTSATKEIVRATRVGSIQTLASEDPIDGIDPVVFREGEKLAADAMIAWDDMRHWMDLGYWLAETPDESASFQLGIALHLRRPIAIIQRQGKTYLDPARVFGARHANGALIHTQAKPNAPETIPTFTLMPLSTLLETLRATPTAYSLVEWDSVNHYDPWIINPSLKAAATAAATNATAAASSGGAAVVEDDGALVDDEWQPIQGGPFIARLMRASRQPPSTESYRNFMVVIPLTPTNASILSPGGVVKFPIVAGGPADGVLCQLPRHWSADTRVLMLTMKLSRDGATRDKVTIASALCRDAPQDSGDDAPDEGGEGDEGDKGGPTPLANPSNAPAPPPPPSVPEDAQVDEMMVEVGGGDEEAEEVVAEMEEVTEVAEMQEVAEMEEVAEMAEVTEVTEMEEMAAVVVAPTARQPVMRTKSTRTIRAPRRSLPSSMANATDSLAATSAPVISDADSMDIRGLSINMTILARGSAPGRGREWYKARIDKFRNRFPPVVVTFIATHPGGETHPLLLPQPKVAFVHKGDIMLMDEE